MEFSKIEEKLRKILNEEDEKFKKAKKKEKNSSRFSANKKFAQKLLNQIEGI
jgi:hypothetical protein